MEQLDLRREWRDLYTARKRPDLIEVPERQALVIAATGVPGSEPMTPLFSSLYPVAYTLKFALKAERDVNYPVLPPEAVYRTADFNRQSDWRWTVAIAVPDLVTPADVRRAIAQVRERHPETPLLDQVKLGRLPGGTQARIMHVGPYDAEDPTIERLVAFVAEAGYRVGRQHIEVYLSDPNRVPPERTRTVIRYPVTPRP